MTREIQKPEILAPAGNRASFLAALAAGADAVYCGLKSFSARMEAKNFAVAELAALTRLAHEKGIRVYVAFNALLKSGDLEEAGTLLKLLHQRVEPDALIIQDLGTDRPGPSGRVHGRNPPVHAGQRRICSSARADSPFSPSAANRFAAGAVD